MKTIKTCWLDKTELASLAVAAGSPPRLSKTSLAEIRAAILSDSRSLATPVPTPRVPLARLRKP